MMPERPTAAEVVEIFRGCLKAACAAKDAPEDLRIPPPWSIRADALRRLWTAAFKAGEKAGKTRR